MGNQPEFMPMDVVSLNWDIDCSLNMHILLTTHLPASHPKKYRKDTPLCISKAIMKLCHPETGVLIQCSKRIVQDCNHVLNSTIKILVEAGGRILVPGLVNCSNGHRNKPERGVEGNTMQENNTKSSKPWLGDAFLVEDNHHGIITTILSAHKSNFMVIAVECKMG